MPLLSRQRFESLKCVQKYLALFLLLEGIVNAAAVAGPSPVKIDGESGKPEEGSCDIDGNPDLYGLGVRLGMLSPYQGMLSQALTGYCMNRYLLPMAGFIPFQPPAPRRNLHQPRCKQHLPPCALRGRCKRQLRPQHRLYWCSRTSRTLVRLFLLCALAIRLPIMFLQPWRKRKGGLHFNRWDVSPNYAYGGRLSICCLVLVPWDRGLAAGALWRSDILLRTARNLEECPNILQIREHRVSDILRDNCACRFRNIGEIRLPGPRTPPETLWS